MHRWPVFTAFGLVNNSSLRSVRAVVQRVSQAAVTVDRRVVAAIGEPGLLVFAGVNHEDTGRG